ncbi:hypothetical protein [Tropicimonas sp.]|uniref:hypothetical protein n=1 Tax=Tropicimonas sp. TaxID=2067044 RepID=UPI003A857D7D
MIIRRTRRALSIVCLSAALAACSTSGGQVTRANSGDAEKDLRRMSAALQRTVIEGALAGAVVGPGFYYRRTVRPANVAAAAATGATLGAAAGYYVGWVQQEYATEEDRLERLKTDLDRNSAEIQGTINVMREVLAQQDRELAAIRARAASGAADSGAVAAEVAEAQANLGEMQKAIDGASRRQEEFGAARGLVPAGGGSAIDPELRQLSNQIAAMRSIATDLAENL